jgi:ParB family chromosome partitioning protein
MSATNALTALKLLAAGRSVTFAAAAVGLTPAELLELAGTHDCARPDGSLDLAAVAAAVTYLERTGHARIPTRAAPAPAPVVRSVPAPGEQVLRQVPLDRLRADPTNPREDVGDVTELAASMRETDLLQPIIARRTGAGQLIVVAGHRRLAAARELGWKSIATVIRADMRPDEVLAAMLIENGQRRDLDPIEEARGLARLKGQLGCTESALAKRIGRSQPHVSARLRLLELSVEDQAAVRAGEMKLVEATAKARMNSGRIRDRRPGAAYFGAAHELAPQARARCRRLHPHPIHLGGGIACGECWESVLRADERAHLHQRSGATGTCALCSTPLPATRKDLLA